MQVLNKCITLILFTNVLTYREKNSQKLFNQYDKNSDKVLTRP